MSRHRTTIAATLAVLTLVAAGAAIALPTAGTPTTRDQAAGPKDQARVPTSTIGEPTRRVPEGCAGMAWPYAPPECRVSGDGRPRPVRVIAIDRRAG